MKTMHIGEFKAQFSDVVDWVKKGDTIRVVKGKTKALVGYFMKNEQTIEKPKRKLGTLSHLGIKIKKEDLEWSDEELKDWGL